MNQQTIRRGVKFLAYLRICAEGTPITAYGAAWLRERALAGGAFQFLELPFVPAQLGLESRSREVPGKGHIGFNQLYYGQSDA